LIAQYIFQILKLGQLQMKQEKKMNKQLETSFFVFEPFESHFLFLQSFAIFFILNELHTASYFFTAEMHFLFLGVFFLSSEIQSRFASEV